MSKKLTTQDFIEKATEIHGDKYDYSKVEYVNAKTKVKIYCKKCEEYFEQTPDSHLQKRGCKKCGNKHNGLNNDIFIERSIQIHGNKYDYSKVRYVNARTKVKIYCKTCEDYFEQTPDCHLNKKYGCRKCSNKHNGLNKRLSLDEIKTRCSEIHNNKYDYSITTYVKYHEKMKYICPTHGIITQYLSSHITGTGCKKCSNNKQSILLRHSQSTILEMLSNIYNLDNYVINLDNYENIKSLINITCKKCNHTFKQLLNAFKKGKGCPSCDYKGRILWTPKLFIKHAKKIHGEHSFTYIKYDISGIKDKIKLQCNKCGHIFETTADAHINVNKNFKNKGCNKCATSKYTTEQFIKLANEKNPFAKYYNYDHVNYVHSTIPIKIFCNICNKFFYTKPHNHLTGYKCNNCNMSNGELFIYENLNKLNINFTQQHTFPGCRYKQVLRFDFYIPNLNLCIEFDGIQHFMSIDYFGSIEGYNNRKLKDNIKTQYCKDNNIELLRIPYWDIDNIPTILEEKLIK